MQLSKESNSAKYQITGYTASSITVNQEVFTTPILVMPQYLAPWPVQSIEQLAASQLEPLIALQPEVILLGTGKVAVFPQPIIFSILASHKIGLEVMTTAAACRTYAALTAEGRKVLAALNLP